MLIPSSIFLANIFDQITGANLCVPNRTDIAHSSQMGEGSLPSGMLVLVGPLVCCVQGCDLFTSVIMLATWNHDLDSESNFSDHLKEFIWFREANKISVTHSESSALSLTKIVLGYVLALQLSLLICYVQLSTEVCLPFTCTEVPNSVVLRLGENIYLKNLF